ncbi:MAG: hypothetical protein WBA93_00935 [Microcoleaceae cyanobacterium]
MDGTSYDKYRELKKYNSQVNLGLEPEKFRINCVLLTVNTLVG